MTVIDLRDVRVAVVLAEEEARFIGGLVEAAVPFLTDAQAELAHCVCCKFVLSAQARIDELVELHGEAAVADLADRAAAVYPNVEDVRLP